MSALRYTAQNHAPVRPMSEARRQHVHGKLEPMEEPSLRADLRHALWVFPLVAVAVVGWAVVLP
jgi:nitrate reductase NapE component